MPHKISNIHELEYQELVSRGIPFRTLDLSGAKLGVHIEEISPGATSSHHHYHSLEEEHVLVFYPERQVLLVKALGAKLFNYEPR